MGPVSPATSSNRGDVTWGMLAGKMNTFVNYVHTIRKNTATVIRLVSPSSLFQCHSFKYALKRLHWYHDI
jgi:hypothetical protein